MQNYTELLKDWINNLETKTPTRPFVTKEIKEFLKKPEIYIKKDYMESFRSVSSKLPSFTEVEDKSKASFVIIFENFVRDEGFLQVTIPFNHWAQ